MESLTSKFQANLVYDFGIGNGNDSANYLARGFNVVAVDADPFLCNELKSRHPLLLGSHLNVVNSVIGSADYTSSTTSFFRNLDFPHLSSTLYSWASRDGGTIEEIMVEVLPLEYFFRTFGVPFYLKSDIEGAELNLLRELKAFETLPKFLSVEDCRFGPQYIEIMKEMGYQKFSIVDQSSTYLQEEFEGQPLSDGTSGHFGPWLQTEWHEAETILKVYFATVRDQSGKRLAAPDRWFDIHGSL